MKKSYKQPMTEVIETSVKEVILLGDSGETHEWLGNENKVIEEEEEDAADVKKSLWAD